MKEGSALFMVAILAVVGWYLYQSGQNPIASRPVGF